MSEKEICIIGKGRVQCYLGKNIVLRQNIGLYGNTQFKTDLTEVDTGYSRSVPCPALPDGLLFDPTKQSQ